MAKIVELTSLQHPLVKHLVKLRDDRQYRYKEKKVVIEGIKLISEIANTHAIHRLIASDITLLEGLKAQETYLVNEAIIKKISAVQNPEGIVAEVIMPSASDLNDLKRVLVLDGINDPGNLGTLLRTALALGWKGAFLLNNCCDPFNDKALRAAKGATFRLPFKMGSIEELNQLITKNDPAVFVADLEGDPLDQVKLKEKIYLILGNEARGPSQETKKFTPVKIPMSGDMESLNVAIAGGILIYFLGRQ